MYFKDDKLVIETSSGCIKFMNLLQRDNPEGLIKDAVDAYNSEFRKWFSDKFDGFKLLGDIDES